MQIQNCTYFNCSKQLLKIDEIVTGYCEEHLAQIESKQYYVGLCWNCNSITLIAQAPEYMSEKYIFSKECIKCTGKSLKDNGKWLTIRNSSTPTLWSVDESGKLRKNPIVQFNPTIS